MTHGSLFSGIGGFDLGFERAGIKTAWQVEIEPFCREVLASRFPGAKRFSDIRECGRSNLEPVDIICAGVPCQDVSVAGKRAGLAGERTGLFYEFARILRELRPAWFVFENVPGLFSSNRGRDFAEILRVLMVECGYGVSWRVLNSQYFGVAQHRRRVFITGRFGKPCPAEILFEPESGERDSTACCEAGKDVAFALAASVRGTGDGHGNAWNSNYVAGTLASGAHASGFNGRDAERGNIVVANSITSGVGRVGSRGADDRANIAYTIRGNSRNTSQGLGNYHAAGRRREDDVNLVATLNSGGNSGGFRTEPGEHLVTFSDPRKGQLQAGEIIQRPDGGILHLDEHVSSPPDSNGVRDFTGLPEGMDSARYRALGNAVTVNVAEWIARRISQYQGCVDCPDCSGTGAQ